MITIIHPYFNQREMLDEHLKEWEKYKNEAKFIIIDDHSDKPLDLDFPNLSIYRILDDIKWNQTGARNLGYHVCETEWALSADFDHVVTEECFRKVQKLDMSNPNKIFFFNRKFTHGHKSNKMHSTFLVNAKRYLEIGGHDEDLAGYYGGVDQSFKEITYHLMKPVWLNNIKVLCYSFNPNIKDANVSLSRKDPTRNLALIKKKKESGFPRGDITRFRWKKIK